MLVEKAQEFPALFLVNERKKDAKGIRIQSLAALIPGFLYRIKHCGVLAPWGEAAWAAFGTFVRNIISNR